MKSLFSELKRRNVFRASAAYAVVVWIVVQGASIAFPAFEVPNWALTMVIVLSALGFPLVVALSWFYELTPEGFKSQKAADRRGYRQRKEFLRHVDFAIIALLVLAVGWLVVKTDEAERATKERRAQAEKMVEFMIGKLGEPLDSSGNLAVLDSIGTEVLDYYAALDPADMDEGALARRAKALLMTGKIEDLRGNLPKAEQYFTAAFATTAELLERTPGNSNRLFDHAQSSFYVGYLDWRRGKFGEAETYFVEYRDLADRLAGAEPGNLDFQGEVAFANSTLGTLYYNQGQLAEALAAFTKAHTIFEKIISFSPDPKPWKQWLAQTHAWLGETNLNLGEFAAAERHRLAQLAIFEEMLAAEPANFEARKDWIRNKGALAELALDRGEVAAAKGYLEEALAISDSLFRFDPENTSWLVEIASIHLWYAEVLLFQRDFAGAEQSVLKGRAIAEDLITRDASVVDWQIDLYHRSQILSARILLKTGKADASLAAAEASAAALEQLRRDHPTNTELLEMLCASYFQAGEAERSLGHAERAAGAWRRAVAAAGPTPAMSLKTKEILAKSLLRLDRGPEAEDIERFFRDIGYRYPDYVDFARQASN